MNQPPKTRKRLVIITGLLFLLVTCVLLVRLWRQLQPDSAESLAFGEQQVEHMVKDCPRMNSYVHKGDPIWQYCVRQFAGEALGRRVVWNNDPLKYEDHYRVQSPAYSLTKPPFIRIRQYYTSGAKQGQERNGEQLWSDVFFALNALRYGKQYYRLGQEALHGKLDKSSWITENTKLDYKVSQDTLRQYQTLWEPQMRAKGLKTVPARWFSRLPLPPTYEQWIARYTNPSGYPWVSWGEYYDEQIVPYQQSREGWGAR